MVKARYYVMEHCFQGEPKDSDFAIKEEELPELKDGEALIEAVWWSVDPFNRAYMIGKPDGTPMIGFQIAKTYATYFPNEKSGEDQYYALFGFVEGARLYCFNKYCEHERVRDSQGNKSKKPDTLSDTSIALKASGPGYIFSTWASVVASKSAVYAVGVNVVSQTGWRTMSVVSDQNPLSRPYPIPDTHPHPTSVAVGVVGMPGLTAYFGIEDLLKPKAGETLVVNAASGAVGGVVGQLAKLKGCNTIGYAGTEEKVAWLKEVGFDHAFNYKKIGVAESLKQTAPNGVDCFFDNVGGAFADAVYPFLSLDSRIAQCGSISTYNVKPSDQRKIDDFRGMFIGKRVSLMGLHSSKYGPRWPEGVKALLALIKEGKLKYQETVYEGFEKMPQALMEQLKGKNNGKSVIKA